MAILNRVVTLAAVAAGSYVLARQMRRRPAGPGGMSNVIESIEVEAPVRAAYNQWTQFEDFPRFMASVHEVRQLDERHLRWRATVGGKEQEWEAEITEQIPDQRIAWHSTGGSGNAGVVTFHRLSDGCTRVVLQLAYQPEGALEKIGDLLGAMRLEARANLQRFKEIVEQRGTETGAWRGTIAAQH
jgi:uncharacterized membrane protein